MYVVLVIFLPGILFFFHLKEIESTLQRQIVITNLNGENHVSLLTNCNLQA